MRPAGKAPAAAGAAGPDARRSRGFLALLGLCFVIFAAQAVPRLTNAAVGDLEFTGWSGPLGSRLLRGEAPYVDFVLPIPPGSFLVMAAIEKLRGRPLLIDELGLIAATQLAMAWLAYAIARAFASRRLSVLVAAASLVMLVRGPKECAYDQTAELLAWGCTASGAWALALARTERGQRLWFVTGFLAAAVLAFKQSTAVGALLGWGAALAYVAVVERTSRQQEALASLARGARNAFLGAIAGVLALLLLLLAIGSTPAAFWQAVFRDGPALKGGNLPLAANLVSYVLSAPAYPASLLLTLAAAGIVVRLARQPNGLRLGAASPTATLDEGVLGFWLPATLMLAAFGTATLLLFLRVSALPPSLAFWTDRLRLLPGFGLLFACLSFAASLSRIDGDGDPARSLRRGHALNATLVATVCIALLHNLSSPEFRPFYDPNPVIALAFLCLFLALERARLPRLALAVFALSMLALFSPKLDRALEAQLPIGKDGHWAGLYVSPSAAPIVRASLRVRELTSETDTVLVLPEDVELAALVGRPRPPLEGAIVFVDQYPARLADEDLGRLERSLPSVVVIRPADRVEWIRLFALWNNRSGARRVTERFLDDWLPRFYRLDSTYPTRFGSSMQNLEVWVRTK